MAPAQEQSQTAESVNPKDLAGRAKPPLHLVPLSALLPVAEVMRLGASKYGPHNWRDQPIGHTPYISAIMRHAIAYAGGESIDPESGQSHLAHIASGALILLDAVQAGTAKDDRPGGVVRVPANDDASEIPVAEFRRRLAALNSEQKREYDRQLVGKGISSREADRALRAAETYRYAIHSQPRTDTAERGW